MSEKELLILVWLARFERFGSITLRNAVRYFGTIELFFHARLKELIACGISPKLAMRFIASRTEADLGHELAMLQQEHVLAIHEGDARYPILLGSIPDAPPVLFVRGSEAALMHERAMAIVGTRSISVYGERVLRLLIPPLTSADCLIVSGLAIGTDAFAHDLALGTGGKTVAVLGSSVAKHDIGPKINGVLAERIVAEGGVLISEYPPGICGATHRFPRRNRIIAGMSQGTAVTEAPTRSGALITAAAALEYGRDVFAVPGPITSPLSEGTNELINTGAIPLLRAETMLLFYGLSPKTAPAAKRVPLSEITDPVAREIIASLSASPSSIETLAEHIDSPIRAILSALSTLELSGRIEKRNDVFYTKD